MFLINQLLQISGNFDSLKPALEFAFSLSDMKELFENGSLECVYQETTDGGFAIGWMNPMVYKYCSTLTRKNKVGKGWNRFELGNFHIDEIVKMICHYLQTQEADSKEIPRSALADYYSNCQSKYNIPLGYYTTKGFLMETVNCETKGLLNPEQGIVIFHACVNKEFGAV